MQVTVGTTVTPLGFGGGDTPLIQNLGPGTVYMGRDDTVTVGNGVRLGVGDAYEFPSDLGASGSSTVYLVSDAAGTDVRYMVVN